MRTAKNYRVLKDFWLNGEFQSIGTMVSLTPRDARAFFSAGQISEVVETDHLTNNSEGETLDDADNDPKSRADNSEGEPLDDADTEPKSRGKRR